MVKLPAVFNLKKIKQSKLAVSFIINFFLLVLLLILFAPAEKTDDFLMKCILSGSATGIPSAHLLYINFLMGGALKILQMLLPGITWFEVIQYMILFLSFWTITYLTWNENSRKKSVLLILPVLLFFGFEAYIKLTYTKTAGIAIVAGLYSLGNEFAKDRMRVKNIIFSYILIILGGFLRFRLLYALSAVFIGSCVTVFLMRHKEDLSKADAKKIIKKGLLFILIFIIAFCDSKVGQKLFRLDSEWKEYKEYNVYKGELQDIGWPDYYENFEAYTELGVSENDYNLWQTRDYGDPAVLTTDLMAEICEMKEKEGIGKYTKNFWDYFKEYPMKFIQINVFFAVVILWILMAFSDIKGKGYAYLYSLGMALLLEYYLYCDGRYDKQHVDVAIWFGIAIFICSILKGGEIKEDKFSLCAMSAIMIAMFVVHNDLAYMTTNQYDGKKFVISQESAREIMDVLAEDERSLYVLSNNEYYGLMRGYDTFEAVPAGAMSNIFILSAFKYPPFCDVLDSFGYDNIYADMCRENVYYVTSQGSGNVDLILTYIQEHYCPTANYMWVNSINNEANVYKFYDEGRL